MPGLVLSALGKQNLLSVQNLPAILYGTTSRFIEGSLSNSSWDLTEYRALSSPASKGGHCILSPAISPGSFATSFKARTTQWRKEQ